MVKSTLTLLIEIVKRHSADGDTRLASAVRRMVAVGDKAKRDAAQGAR